MLRVKRSDALHREMYGILGTKSGVLVPDGAGKCEMGTESGVFVPEVVWKCEMGTKIPLSVPISMDVIPRRAMVAG